ncbi:DUF1501 domain-containing protein [Zavarzinella formosa]|uniref:DUF1501 domain-containing protein n=1 Tax=Zavarzinella formosa TaxID=360055 RepID=UPI0002FFC3E5|nr:DUF1501 domain-containing protein [Zavarzinella formosa]
MSGFQLDRRAAIRVGGAGLLGLSLPELLAASSHPKACAKSVIFLHQFGGPGQHETFDMKPNAPAEVRGSFKPIQTNVPGLQVCEMLPRVAEVAKHLTVIRCAQHTMKNHNSAAYYSLTGMAPPSDDQRLRDSLDLFPAYGSIVDKFAPASRAIPTFVSFPHVIRDGSISPGQHASFLGKGHNPFFFAQDPNKADFRLPELSLPASVSPDRMEHRTEVLRIIDEQADRMDQSIVARGLGESYHKAVNMLTSPDFKKAFDLSKETRETRDRYGRTTYGQSCLLARRLVEVGAKFINVYFSEIIGGDKGGWDVHGFDNHPQDPILKNHLLPITNQTLPTLISDLDERGLLKDTLVLWMGEFGRTPRINKLAGRDHWPQCYSLVMAGGGVKGGFIYGASDKIGAYPTMGQARPEDISATLFHMMGINPESEIRDRLNRPMPVSRGEVIRDIIA